MVDPIIGARACCAPPPLDPPLHNGIYDMLYRNIHISSWLLDQIGRGLHWLIENSFIIQYDFLHCNTISFVFDTQMPITILEDKRYHEIFSGKETLFKQGAFL